MTDGQASRDVDMARERFSECSHLRRTEQNGTSGTARHILATGVCVAQGIFIYLFFIDIVGWRPFVAIHASNNVSAQLQVGQVSRSIHKSVVSSPPTCVEGSMQKHGRNA
jgi:hypothetical protein